MSSQGKKIDCEACGIEDEVKVDGIMDLAKALPRRWRRRVINFRAYILCDVCGHPRQFTKGCSPYILDALDLPPNATCEIEEIEDFRGHPDNVTWRRERQRAKK
ncbi:MAG: hypothetical protein GY927_01350 [bacterium]|nr:hypothetical protein [bacterium]